MSCNITDYFTCENNHEPTEQAFRKAIVKDVVTGEVGIRVYSVCSESGSGAWTLITNPAEIVALTNEANWDEVTGYTGAVPATAWSYYWDSSTHIFYLYDVVRVVRFMTNDISV